MNKTGIVIIVCAMAVVGAILFLNRRVAPPEGVACTQDARMCPDGSYVGRVAPSCDFAACPPVATSTTQTVGVYPLYSGMTWGNEASTTMILKDQTLSGTEIVSEIIPNITNIGAVASDFQTYYSTKLLNEGWMQDKNLAADGAGSSVWVYTKGNQFIVFSYRSEAVNQATNAPLTCPCNMRFTIFIGTKI
jgi:hypothetical protein